MNRGELKSAWQADFEAMGYGEWGWRQTIDPSMRARITRFLRRLRRIEWLEEHAPSLPRRVWLLIAWRRHLRAAAILGFEIPPGVCGPGLMPAHVGPITINGDAKIGSRCRVHPGVLVGATENGAPTIGDNAYLGNGAKIYGPVTLGDNVVVAPNAVVLSDVPSNCLVAGVPAVIKKRDVPLKRFRL